MMTTFERVPLIPRFSISFIVSFIMSIFIPLSHHLPFLAPSPFMHPHHARGIVTNFMLFVLSFSHLSLHYTLKITYCISIVEDVYKIFYFFLTFNPLYEGNYDTILRFRGLFYCSSLKSPHAQGKEKEKVNSYSYKTVNGRKKSNFRGENCTNSLAYIS